MRFHLLEVSTTGKSAETDCRLVTAEGWVQECWMALGYPSGIMKIFWNLGTEDGCVTL